jgi:hypothetical protein
VEFQLGSGELALGILRRWLIPASGYKGLVLSVGEGNYLAWAIGPQYTGQTTTLPPNNPTLYLDSNRFGGNNTSVLCLPLDVMLGDFTEWFVGCVSRAPASTNSCLRPVVTLDSMAGTFSNT